MDIVFPLRVPCHFTTACMKINCGLGAVLNNYPILLASEPNSEAYRTGTGPVVLKFCLKVSGLLSDRKSCIYVSMMHAVVAAACDVILVFALIHYSRVV